MQGVLAVTWVAGLAVGNKAGKMHQEPYNAYADIQACQFGHSGFKTVVSSLLQNKLKKILLLQNIYLFWGERNLMSAPVVQILLTESIIKCSASNS